MPGQVISYSPETQNLSTHINGSAAEINSDIKNYISDHNLQDSN